MPQWCIMNKNYTEKRLSGLCRHKGKTYEETYGPEKALQMKEKMRQAKLGKKRPPRTWDVSGERHWNWKGGVSRAYKDGYYSVQYKTWRRKVFERDDYTCQECGARGYITAHHKKSFAHYPKLKYVLDNGITLCESCHSKTDNYRGRNKGVAIDK
jgi:5-methylcytosine-specific restriction endonuclease McrA